MSVLPYNNSNFPVYRFYINTFSSTTYEVFPLNFNETSLMVELERDQSFYRHKFEGMLLFGTNDKVLDVSGNEQNRMDDFTLLWAFECSNPCAVIYLTITKTVSGVVDTYWEGSFSTTDGIFDLDKCTFAVKPTVLDDYTTMIEEQEKQYNILLGVDHDKVTEAIRGTIHYTYSRNMWLMDVIEYLGTDATNGISPGSTISSDFFTDATNPATGLDNQLLYMMIATKSDIMFPSPTSDPATSAMLSWKELMEILWGVFQVRWNYDADTDTINIEHISWFESLGSLDIRDQLLTQSTNKYSYTKEKMPKYEYFEWVEADEINFIGKYIYYPNACIDGNYETNRKTTKVNVTTDIEYIQEQMAGDAENINPEGFVLLCNYEEGGNYYVVVESGAYYPANARLNMPMSWANLHDKYFRHHRPAIEGYLNNTLVTFYTAIKTKKQPCSIILCDTFDPNNEIITELGTTYLGGVTGIVGHAKISPSGAIDLEILYGPPDNELVPIVTKVINFIQEYETIYWYLSSPSDANYTFHPYEEIYDDTGDPAGSACQLVCSEGEVDDPESFSININDTKGSFTFSSICPGYAAGYTMWIQIEDISGTTMIDNGWTVIMKRDCDYINTECQPCG